MVRGGPFAILKGGGVTTLLGKYSGSKNKNKCILDLKRKKNSVPEY